MAENALVAESRSGTGKGVARKLRAAGRIPAVMYGMGREPTPLSVDPAALSKLLLQSGAGRNALIDLQIDGGSQAVLVKDLQRDPVTGHSLHADFLLVDLTEKVEVTVALHFVGKSRGVELGGLMDHPVRELQIECLPTAIPEFLEVDMTELDVGDTLHVRDVALPEGVVCKTDGDQAIAICFTPKAAEEEGEGIAEEEGGAAAAASAPGEGDSGAES